MRGCLKPGGFWLGGYPGFNQKRCTPFGIPPSFKYLKCRRVDGFLPKLKVDVCILRCRLVSRRCHNISTILQLSPAPLRTVLALFTHTAPHVVVHEILEHADLDAWTRKRKTLLHKIELLPAHAPLTAAAVKPFA